MERFYELLRKPQGKNVYWDANLQEKFQEVKDVIYKLAKKSLTLYDKDRPTVVVTDWSEVGIGFLVMQQYCKSSMTGTPLCCKSRWRLALCGSRHLTRGGRLRTSGGRGFSRHLVPPYGSPLSCIPCHTYKTTADAHRGFPVALRRRIAVNLHAGHQNLDGMLGRVRQAVYWPGMEGDLQYYRNVYATCNANSSSQAAEPFSPTPPP